MNNEIKNIKSKITEVVTNVLREESQYNAKLMTEHWSYLDDMDSAMSHIYDLISNNAKNDSTANIGYGIQFRKGEIRELSLFGINGITFFYYIYNSSNDSTCDFVIRECYSENNYDEENKILTITLYTVNGQLIEEISNKNLSHELNHILQISMGSTNNKNYSTLVNGAYNYASEIITSDDPNDYDKLVAWLIYYSNPHEQDAFMNEYYQDLRNHKQYIYDKNSETHNRLADYKGLCDKYKKSINSKELTNAVSKYKLYGYNIKNINIMIDKGLHRFIKKMKNIEKHFIDVVYMANETHFHLKPISNGSLIVL